MPNPTLEIIEELKGTIESQKNKISFLTKAFGNDQKEIQDLKKSLSSKDNVISEKEEILLSQVELIKKISEERNSATDSYVKTLEIYNNMLSKFLKYIPKEEVSTMEILVKSMSLGVFKEIKSDKEVTSKTSDLTLNKL